MLSKMDCCELGLTLICSGVGLTLSCPLFLSRINPIRRHVQDEHESTIRLISRYCPKSVIDLLDA